LKIPRCSAPQSGRFKPNGQAAARESAAGVPPSQAKLVKPKETTIADSQQKIAANEAIDNHSAACAFCNEPDTVNELACTEKGRLYEDLRAIYAAEKAERTPTNHA
jgi:hypothetical protein